MSEHDLRSALGRAAGAPDARPELDDLWVRGRGRRRRTRVLATAAAVVAVLALVVGAVALAATDGDEDVVAGPVAPPAGAPPVEPTEGPITIDLTAGPVVDGLPTAEPGEVMTLAYVGTGGFGRPAVAAWERWDGAAWVGEHTLVVEQADEPGSGQVLDADVTVDSGELRFEEEIDRYPTPEALEAGWYRVCVPMHRYSGVGPTEPAGASTSAPEVPVEGESEPTVTAGPETTTTLDPEAIPPSTPPERTTAARYRELPSGEQIAPCAQLRVPVADAPDEETAAGPTTMAPPPALTDAEREAMPGTESVEIHAYPVGVQPYGPGLWVTIQVARGGGVTLGSEITWEQWDGTDWVRTHRVEGLAPQEGPARLVPLDDDGTIPESGATIVSERDVTNLTVPIPPLDELTSPWSRVCFDAEPSGLGRPCARLEVDGAGGTTPVSHGDDATWVIDPASPPTPGATTVDVLVTRVGCNGGRTGEVLAPLVDWSMYQVTITIDVERVPGGDCPGNDAVPVTVDLGEELGDRAIHDGWCQGSTTASVECVDPGELRWALR